MYKKKTSKCFSVLVTMSVVVPVGVKTNYCPVY